MEKRIWISPPHLTGNELTYLKEVIDSNWVTVVGPQLNHFATAIAGYTQSPHITLTNSGTSALHLALRSLGVGKDDFVITSTFTFVASVNPIAYLGAKPILIESETETWNMSPVFLEESILWCLKMGKKPKAILLVHLYGMPAQIELISAIAKKYDIPLIEDAAEALGSTYKNKHLGTFGCLGLYSFNGNKIITTSSGGALISDDVSYIKKAKFLASQAKEDKRYYEHKEMGYNYQMTTLNAAMGLAQFEKLEDYIKLRRRNFDYYKLALSPFGFQFLEEPNSNYYSNRWLTTMLWDKKEINASTESLKEALKKENIESRLLWKPMHTQPLYKKAKYFGDKTSEKLFKKGLCLPSGSSLSESDLERITAIIIKKIKA
ncbi:MAG: DegT/DnrJ/EryC1/StrS family aminotransferase [Flavobacteriaceae bacterium]|nr:DegT/DnrJ/EryC1/StrS family aminotransferase [Flavobacteriaceae bacterium]